MNGRCSVLVIGLLLASAAASCRRDSLSGQTAPALLFGSTGAGPVEFNYPRAIALLSDDRLVVIDKGGRVQILSQAGEYIRDWPMPEISAGRPTGLGISPDGRIYVADTHYHRVQVFSATGELLESFGSRGQGPGEFRLPTDVAFARDGSFYVAEYGGNDRISKFTPNHEYLFSFGGTDAGEARLQRPQSIMIAPDGTLWVTDSCSHRICHFDSHGNLLAAFGHEGTGPGELWFPYSIDMLSDGTLVVCEFGNNRVQRFDQTGASRGTWGRAGRNPGELAYPWALAVGRDDRVFIIDSGNNRVQVINGLDSGTWSRPLP